MGGARGGGNVEGGLSGDLLDEIDAGGVFVGFVLVGVVFFADRDFAKRGALFAQVGDDGARVDSGNGGDAFARAPLSQAFHCRPVRVLQRHVRDHDAAGLNVGALEVLQQAVLVPRRGRHAVIPNQRLREDQDLAAVGRVGHGLRIADQ